MTLAASEDALVWAGFDGQAHAPETRQWPVAHSHPVLQRACDQLQAYFAGERTRFDVPINLDCGSAFQQRVWQALLTIAPGQTVSYGWMSQQIGQPGAMRAVGGAIGRNPISILIPCHRVVGSRGALTGYAGGLNRKIALLELELELESHD